MTDGINYKFTVLNEIIFNIIIWQNTLGQQAFSASIIMGMIMEAGKVSKIYDLSRIVNAW